MAWGFSLGEDVLPIRSTELGGLGVNQKDCVWIDTSTFQVMAVLIPKSTDSG